MAWGNRKHSRVVFERALEGAMIGIDGSWQSPCKLVDISEGGARLIVSGPIDELKCREFFLMLSQGARTFRRCELVRVAGGEIGVRFVKKGLMAWPTASQDRRTKSAS